MLHLLKSLLLKLLRFNYKKPRDAGYQIAISAALSVGSSLLIALLTPKPKINRLDDLSSPKATAGSPIFYVWGTVRIAAARIWATDLVESIESSGGKGLFGGPQVAKYYANFADMYCNGPIVGFLRIWLDKKIRYDVRSSASDETLQSSSDFAYKYLRLHLGEADQPLDSLIEEKDGEPNTPAYNYRAYVSFDTLPLDEYGNRAPTTDVELSANGTIGASSPIYETTVYQIVTWSSLIDCTQLQGSLQKTGISSGWNAGARSTQTIAAGSSTSGSPTWGTTGYVTFAPSNGDQAFGLSNADPNPSDSSIQYGIKVTGGTSGSIIESGTVRATFTYSGGQLKISTTDTNIQYWDGSGLIYTSSVAPTYPLFVDCSLYTPGAILNASIMPVIQSATPPTPRITTAPVLVGDIIRDLCVLWKIPASNVDVSELDTEQVIGFAHGTQRARDSIEVLARAFFLECIETGTGLRFQRQKRPSVSATIPIEDLMAREGGAELVDLYVEEILDPIDLPKQVKVTFINQDLDYDKDQVDYLDPGSTGTSVDTYDLPIVMSREVAANIPRRLCALASIERFQYKFTLPPKYLFLEAGDVVAIPIRGTTKQVKIKSLNITAAFTIEISSVGYDSLVFDDVPIEAIPNPGYQNSTIPAIATTQYQVLDVPLARTSDTDLGMYAVANGVAGWRYGVLYASRDGGANYSEAINPLVANPIGVCLTALPTALYGLVDYASTLMVEMQFGSLSSTSFTQIFNGVNWAYVGNNLRGWEVIAYQNAVQQTTPNQYLLSVFRRGLSGTQSSMSIHTATDYFIPIVNPQRFLGSASDLSLAAYFKALSPGQSLDEVTTTIETYQGRDVRPYPPSALRATRQTSGDWLLNWSRCDRRASQYVTWSTVPQSDPESYKVEILDGSTVVRVVAPSTNSYTYPLADQVTDFGSGQTSLSFRVAQLDNYGRYGGVTALA